MKKFVLEPTAEQKILQNFAVFKVDFTCGYRKPG